MGSQAKTTEPHHEFACSGTKRPADENEKRNSHARASLNNLWLGLAAARLDDGRVKVGFACHDGTYTMDFAVDILSKGLDSHSIEDHVIDKTGSYARENAYRYLGAGNAEQYLLSRLRTELNIVPIIVKVEGASDDVDEAADPMARKCVM